MKAKYINKTGGFDKSSNTSSFFFQATWELYSAGFCGHSRRGEDLKAIMKWGLLFHQK
jgi:hypothetical protein